MAKRRPHEINGKPVRVKVHLECLGQSGGTVSPYQFPEPYVFQASDDDSRLKLQFLSRADRVWQSFVQQVAKEHGAVSFATDTLTVTCKLSMKDSGERAKTRTWREDVEEAVDSNMKLFKVGRRQVPDDLWQDAVADLEAIPNERDQVTLNVRPDERSVTVVGMGTHVDQRLETIEKIIDRCLEKIEQLSNMIKKVKKLPAPELFLLYLSPFYQEPTEKDRGTTVSIDLQSLSVTFQGLEQDVNKEQVRMYEFLDGKISQTVDDMSKDKQRVLSSHQSKMKISKKFQKKGTVASWDVTGGGVEVYSFDPSHLRLAVQILRNSVTEKVCELCQASVEVLESEDGKRMTDNLEKDYAGLLVVGQAKGGNLTITGLHSIIENAERELERFLKENTLFSESLWFSPCRQKVISALVEKQQAAICEELKAWRVRISVNPEGVAMQVSGTRFGLQKVRDKLEEMEKQIIVHTEHLKDEFLIKVLNSEKCQSDVELAAKENSCVIGSKPEPAGLQVLLLSTCLHVSASFLHISSSLSVYTCVCARARTFVSFSLVRRNLYVC